MRLYLITNYYGLACSSGFKKEEVKLQVEGSGHIIIGGGRQVNEEKHVRFELVFPVPKDSDMDKIAGKFDGEILYVTITKRSNNAQGTKETKTAKATASNEGTVGRAEEHRHEEHRAVNERRDQRHDEEERGRNETDVHHRIGNFSQDLIRKWENEPSILTSAVEVLSKNKRVVITAVLAFSLGWLVCRKFQSSTSV